MPPYASAGAFNIAKACGTGHAWFRQARVADILGHALRLGFPMFLGIDFGTTGARACVIAPTGQIEDMARLDFGDLPEHEAAASWREALFSLIAGIPAGMRRRMAALSIDGTSGTVLACDEALNPTFPPLPYNDARAVEEAKAIARAAGAEHPAAGATSGLAKVLWLKKRLGQERARLYLNQADWLSALLSGRPVATTTTP